MMTVNLFSSPQIIWAIFQQPQTSPEKTNAENVINCFYHTKKEQNAIITVQLGVWGAEPPPLPAGPEQCNGEVKGQSSLKLWEFRILQSLQP